MTKRECRIIFGGKKIILGQLYKIPDDFPNTKIHLFHSRKYQGNNLLWKEGGKFDTEERGKRVFCQRSIKYDIEREYEKSRIAINKELPSRESCIFLCLFKEDINCWTHKTIQYQLVEVRLLSGKIVFIDESHYDKAKFNDNSATSYWNGCFVSQKSIVGLFEGKFEVVSDSHWISHSV